MPYGRFIRVVGFEITFNSLYFYLGLEQRMGAFASLSEFTLK